MNTRTRFVIRDPPRGREEDRDPFGVKATMEQIKGGGAIKK